MIRMNDFKALPKQLRQSELNAIQRVMDSGWYILGEEVERFELQWAKRCGARHAIGVGNGMDAIEIGLRSLSIGPGDEVITTPMTAFATVLAILRAGATPVLADIDPRTALLDITSAQRCLSRRTKAVILVHLYGQVRWMDRWLSFCRDNKIHLLEDCAQSHLAAEQGRVAGAFGTWGAYSFYPTKNLGAMGDGGALVSNSDDIAIQARELRNYGQSRRYHHPRVGLNSRLDEMQAAILSERLQYLDQFTLRRRDIAAMYFSQITNSHIGLMDRPAEVENHVFHLFVVLSRERERLAGFLKEQGIESFIHYPVPVHRQKSCEGMRCDPHGLSVAEVHSNHCLSIPCHPQMSDSDVRHVTAALNRFC